MAKKKTEEATTNATQTPAPIEIEVKPINYDTSKIPFTSPAIPDNPYITLPGSAFFDQELGEVIYNKLMKAPVKDVQVLLWLSKLWTTINNIAKELVGLRDALAEAVWFDLAAVSLTLTPEALNSAEYQAKSRKFGELLQEHVFNKTVSLEPLGCLTLDLTNPDGHAKSFIEGSSLSADDIMKLSEAGILKVESGDTEESPKVEDAPAEDGKETDGADESAQPEDVLVPNTEE